jgi:ParB-like chromosome segregation protein Spo0J
MVHAEATPSQAEKRREVKWRALDQLLLDNKNPRLPDGFQNATQAQLLNLLAEDYALPDIGSSIAENGYFSEEPLVTIEHPTLDKWIVVEGNRRLAALLLLVAPKKAPKELQDTWTEIADGAKKTVSEVPTLVYSHRREITPYLGFRHITGVLEWRPYQKGRYVAELVEEGKLDFAEIARLIGSKSKTVREHYVSYTLVRQAKNSFNLDTERAQESFGILRRALSDPSIRDYIGLELDRKERELSKPLKKSDAVRLDETFRWMFGTKSKAAAIRESRDLSKLGAVLANDKARAALKTSGDLSYAFELSGGEEKRLIEALSKASYQLDQALPMVIRHKKSKDVLTLAEKCLGVMEEIARLLDVESR